MKTIGTVSEMWRFPVKSFAGERLPFVDVVHTGFYGDRSHAYIDPAKPGWSRYITARAAPDMLRYRAVLGKQASAADGMLPPLYVTTPDGEVFGWEEALHNQIRSLVHVVIEPQAFSSDEQEPAFDEGSILIVTDASLRSLEALWGKPLDALRFRPNMIIQLNDDTPFVERAWIGRLIRLGGGVVLRIDSLCSRCMMIGFDPETLASDGSLLSLLSGEQAVCFGVYASVVATGRLAVGDPVLTLDE